MFRIVKKKERTQAKQRNGSYMEDIPIEYIWITG
jgi:hypothetical protein